MQRRRFLQLSAGALAGCASGTVLATASSVVFESSEPRPGEERDFFTGETEPEFRERTRWWREARFGMFIHWGIYSVPADSTDLEGKKETAEWYLTNQRMQVKDYERFAAEFKPSKFNAAEWVKTAKDAGMEYLVITSKHHDGFCMFDSKLTDYTVTKAAPWEHDPMNDLAAECRRQGVKLGFYYSIMDWHHPDYLPRRKWDARPATGASLDRYIGKYVKGQLRELLTNYGPVGVLWFDGDWEHCARALHSHEVNQMVRSLQPPVVINDRNRLPADYSTPEQFVPPKGLPGRRLWETCMTINDTWGYAKNDTNWKSADELIRKLCDAAGKGGNFLLNVGPTAQGVFPEATRDRLARLGDWMKVNGKAIRGSDRGPFRRVPFRGSCTQRGRNLYLLVFDWPENGITLTGLRPRILSARALDGGQELNITAVADERASLVQIPRPQKIDPAATVVELKFAGTPTVAEPRPAVEAGPDGTFVLAPIDAEMHGWTAQYEVKGLIGENDFLGPWTSTADYALWACHVVTAGRYRVQVTYAAPPEIAGSAYSVGLERGERVKGIVKATGDCWTDFKAEVVGELRLPAGRLPLTLRVDAMPRGAAMNLRQVRLIRT